MDPLGECRMEAFSRLDSPSDTECLGMAEAGIGARMAQTPGSRARLPQVKGLSMARASAIEQMHQVKVDNIITRWL